MVPIYGLEPELEQEPEPEQVPVDPAWSFIAWENE